VQRVQVDDPLNEKKFRLQSEHALNAAIPIPVPYFPAAQLVHLLEPTSSPYVPDAHLKQTDCPPVEYVPDIEQLRHVALDVDLFACENVPGMHFSHSYDPFLDSNVPGRQDVHTDNPEVENVPCSHGIQLILDVVCSLLEYVPTPHFMQAISLTPVEYVPAGQFEQ